MKAAHAAVAWCSLQEIRVKPFFGLSGIMRRKTDPSFSGSLVGPLHKPFKINYFC
jgi:hypothetical protein